MILSFGFDKICVRSKKTEAGTGTRKGAGAGTEAGAGLSYQNNGRERKPPTHTPTQPTILSDTSVTILVVNLFLSILSL